MDAKPLIDAIVADPDDEATWLVYADWLLERGDPRGELIRLTPAAEADNAARWRISQIENDEERLFSPALAAHARQWRVDWQRGFIRHAELMNETRDDVGASTLPALCGDPHVGLLSALTINLFDDWEYEIDQITGRERERRRRMRYTIGDVGLELPRLTRLSNLTLRGIALQPLTHEGIESLSLDANGLAGEFSLPQLESLSVEFSSGVVDHWPLLQRPPSKLGSLFLDVRAPSVVTAVASSTVLRQLERLSFHEPSVAVLAAIVEHAAQFRSVPELHFGAVLTDLRDPNVITVRQDIERLFSPRDIVDIHWIDSNPHPEPEPEPEVEPNVDAQSRGPDGQIDPIGAWVRGRPRPTD